MTQQSGQGAASSDPHPADRHAHEGIVLPADGSEPLMPGTTGDQVAPAGGSPWGQPWGPAPADPPPGSGQPWDSAQGQQQTYGAGTPLPADGEQHQGYPQGASYGGQQPTGAYGGRPPGDPYGQQSPNPAYGGQPQGGYAEQPQGGYAGQPQGGQHAGPAHGGQHAGQPAAGVPYAGPGSGGAHAGQPALGAHARPAAGGAHAGQPADASYPGQPADASYPGQPGQPLPAAGQPGQAGQAGQLPPAAQAPGLGGGVPLPPVAGGLAPLPPAPAGDADATQYIPAMPGAAAGAGGGVDEGATQYIPPVAPGALPPEAPAGEATQFLGHGPMPGAAPMPPAAGSDNEPTQFIAPVPAEPGKAPFGIRPGAPGDRQPPAEFDSLFRTEQPDSEGPASTQQMPRFEPPQAAAHGQGDGGGRAARRAAAAAPAPRGGGRTGSKVPLFAAAGVVIALIGVGAGALLSGGGGDEEKDDPKTVSDSAPADEKPSPSVDPAKEQAVALDKLLADSNNSRASVIVAVRNVGKCADLSKSATDLRNAAKQRNGLVTRLSTLSVDKLPANAQLTASLTKAWKASASADNHYAAWAGQVAGKKGCKKGHARSTPHAIAANKASGEATTAKQEAAGLWNAIAKQYGLTTRDKSQL